MPHKLGLWKILALIILIWSTESCNPDRYFTAKNTLISSTDTVWFDTVFTREPASTYPISVTKIFSIKNPENLTVKASFHLGGGEKSPYRIAIDGESGIAFTDIEIGAKDSIFVFVQCKLNANNQIQPMLVMDSLISLVGGQSKNTKLAAYGWDAHYFRDTIFQQDVTFSDNLKPYVIVGFMGVKSNTTLTIKPGVQLFASYPITNSMNKQFIPSLFIFGTLDIQGTAGNRVTIRGNKPVYQATVLPNQWYGIYFAPGSINNKIQYTDITNAMIGIRVDSLPTNANAGLQLINTRIQYCGQACMVGITSKITAQNCLFADAGTYSFLGLLGGDYYFNHCTFVDYSGFSSRTDGNFAITNTLRDGNGKLIDHKPLLCKLYNSIVYGRNKEELQFDQSNLSVFDVFIENNLLKSQNPKGILIAPNYFNKTPGFIDIDRGNYQLDSTAFGIKKALIFGSPVADDLLGRTRKSMPDIGCYEKIP